MSVLGTWGKPPDAVAWVALAGALALFVIGLRGDTTRAPFRWLAAHEAWRRPRTAPTRRFLVIVAFAAAFLSLGYIEHYLRGGPRIIDATSYFLQGRALSHGDLAFHVIDPTASFRGRFLLFHEPDRLGGIFPPGYPLLLALGFLIGAPMVIGPLLAAALACSTYLLVHELAAHLASPPTPRERETWARVGALVSVACAALRYHTADTMAHGASALAISLGLVAMLRARRRGSARGFVLVGLAVGYVAATRIPSSFALGLASLVLAARLTPDAPGRSATRERLRAVAFTLIGTLPGVLLLLASQKAVTGNAFTPTQAAYYATSDGPPGCFRYGFGQGIGCLFEHGDFVRARLEGASGTTSFGALAALGTTARRLRMHLADVANWEPLTLLLVVLVVPLVRRERAVRVAALLVLGQVAAYAPFYFDGNYPGGGARFYADVLPIEHALAVLALARGVTSARFSFLQRSALFLGAALLGFAVHGVFDHRALAERDGGRTMFEPDLVREAHQDFGLLFFDTDHGFNLAFDPEVTSSHGVMAVRRRHDDRDRILYDAMGHPMSTAYHFHEDGSPSSVELFVPPAPGPGGYRFEAESDWPPLAQTNGWALPKWVSGTGSSNDRVLELVAATPRAGEEATASAEIELPIPPAPPSSDPAAPPPGPRHFQVRPRVFLEGAGAHGTLILFAGDGRAPPKERARWTWSDAASDIPRAMPYELDEKDIGLVAPPARLRLEVHPLPSAPTTTPGKGEDAARLRILAVALDKTTVREVR